MAVTLRAANVATDSSLVTPSMSRFAGDSAKITFCPVSRPMMNTTGIVRPTVDTKRPVTEVAHPLHLAAERGAHGGEGFGEEHDHRDQHTR